MSSSLNRGDIGVLAVDKLVDGSVCTMVRINDPRSSLVHSYPGDKPIVLSKDERMSIVPVTQIALNVSSSNFTDFEKALPYSKTYILLNNDVNPTLLVYDHDDFNEANSIIACSSEPEAILEMVSLINARNSSFDLAAQLKKREQSYSQLDEVSIDNSHTPTLNM